MWARHRPEVTLRDLGFALRALLATGGDEQEANAAIVREWIPEDEAVACLSVRSGFDLLLQAIPLREGDEILFTEVSIAGMLLVAERAGCVVRGLPVDRVSLAATAEAVKENITPRTRAVVFAPLFGSRNPIGPLAEVAREHSLLVIEDAAQAFAGTSYGGSQHADVTMFSFGMIKRATAGGGAVLRVRNPEIRNAMLERLNTYPRQTHRDYARRLAMLSLLRVASNHRIYGALRCLLAAVGDPDSIVSKMGKTRNSQQSLERLRRQPCGAMKRVMARRIHQHAKLASMVSRETIEKLGDTVCGSQAEIPPQWVLPVGVHDPVLVASELCRLGFDASALSSLVRIAPNDDRDADHWLQKTLFLPTDTTMGEATRERLIRAVLSCEGSPTSPRSC